MLSLKDWEEAWDFAEKICKESRLNVKPEVYTMYDGRKGIYIKLFDKNDNYYIRYASGIWDTYFEMENALKWCLVKLEAA